MNATPVTPTDNSNGQCPSRDELAELLNDVGGGPEHSAWEAHLGECDRCQRILQELAVANTEWEAWDERIRGADVPWPDATVHTADLSDPDRWPNVPGYQIQELIGRGGMGVVFRARHLALDRQVALKTLPLAGANQGMLRKRLQREAEAMARIHHPHVVQIFEILDCDGVLVLVLEYIRGGSLADRLRESVLAPPEAARLLELVARTMQVAHDADILHRDLKPANVLLTVDGIPKVTDFGLARRVEDPGDTKTGQIIGTPSYLAPEQARGLEGWSTPAVDVYGIGAILYEALTGRPPFRAATSFETLRQVVHERPVSPSRLQQKLPRDLVTICLKCLRKDPAKRYASCRELADDLERFQTGQPIRARRISSAVRAGMWIRRHPIVAALSLAFVVSLGLLVGLSIRHSVETAALNEQLRAESERGREQQRQAETARDNMNTERKQAMLVLSQMSAAMRNDVFLPPAAGNRQPMLRLPLKSYAIVLSRFEYPELRLEQAKGYHWLGQLALQHGDINNSTTWMSRAVTIRTGHEVNAKRDPLLCLELTRYHTDYATALLASKRYDDAVKQLQIALKIIENPKSGPEDPLFRRAEFLATIYYMLARVRAAQRKRRDSRAALETAMKVLTAVPTSQRTRNYEMMRAAIRRALDALKSKPKGK